MLLSFDTLWVGVKVLATVHIGGWPGKEGGCHRSFISGIGRFPLPFLSGDYGVGNRKRRWNIRKTKRGHTMSP